MSAEHRRKTIRLKDYDYSQNNAYFVTVCTHGRQSLFGQVTAVGAHPCVRPPDGNFYPEIVLSEAGEMIIKWLEKLPERFPEYLLDTYVVMPDHIHILIVCCGQGGHMGPPLPKVIQWFKTQSTNEYIRGVRAKRLSPFYEKLWQRSFYDHIIRSPQEMQAVRKYIYENPLRWFAENEEEYPWN